MMETLIMWTVLPLAIWLIPIFVLGGILYFSLHRANVRDRRNPLSRGMLRGPGHWLREQIDDARADLLVYPIYFSAIPLFLYTALIEKFGANGLQPFHWIVIGLSILGVIAIVGRKIMRLTTRLRDLRLGFEAETAVGQELNLLMQDGFFVFHDVPGDKSFNVDHVVVGRQGVFAVETKGRAKPIRSGEAETHKVQYDGKQLLFPGWIETKPLEQARRNAEWLRKWLSAAVGAPVEVKPVLMLPGWYIDRTSRPGMAVMNGTNSKSFFMKATGQPLSDQLVRQIVHQLDTRCRDIEPKSYKPLQT